MTRIKVFEDTDPTVTLRLKQRLPGDLIAPLTLDGASEIEFNVKDSRDAETNLFSYTLGTGEVAVVDDGTGVDDEYSEITVQFDASDIAAAATHYYHVAVTKAGKRNVVDADFLEIVNV